MKNSKLLAVTIAAFLLFSTGCKKDVNFESSDLSNDLLMSKKTTAPKPQQVSPDLQQKLNKLVSDSRLELKPNARIPALNEPIYRDIIRKALAVEPTQCDANTPINLWLDQQLADWNGTVISYAINTAMLDLPNYDALLFENSSANQYFGLKGEYTQRINKTFKDLKRFWNIQTNGIVLTAMHGNMLTDRNKLIRTYTAAYGLGTEDAEYYADLVLALLDAFSQYRNGDHPIFTFNAFAVKGFNFPPYGVIPDKIIMGDGILEAFDAIGYGDVAPQAILAHEFGHHIQYQLNLFTDVNSPEATRRTELMADAYSAYYLSHARGASMQWKRVKLFLQVFFNIGDCSFNSTGHHGTPAQRMAAAEWGYNVANNAQKQGHILSAQEFTTLFEAQLPVLVSL
ncbi:hypothetical protein GS399_19845 [Pedobacter sp. HMF7647]|uniref:Uncharacterized protein n=1 Tax=Hufsiella arboris TaxID=2695275 RepID=A0A7K1YF50_9SPHI|nr:hypothetical protein [Hufsiella arboris]MXV53225.1 hypothetical protein [Hufsiella arboris]